MKRTLFKKRTFTSLVVLLMTMPVWGNDGDTFTEETLEGTLLTYTVISEAEKTCMVGEEYNPIMPTTQANGVREVSQSQLSGDITIPEVANGYAVIRIEVLAFANTAITSVVIPNSVKDIGPGAFIGCANLKSVRLSNQLTTINYATFQDCASLTSIDIPDGVTSIATGAFYGCIQLKEANIPSSVEQFGENVFCSAGFTSMPKLPEGLTTIPYGIFESCPLTSVEIPQNITSIEGCAFNNCPISEIEIPASVTHIGVAAFARCKNLSSIVIPDNVSTIDLNAFKDCSNLKTVTLSSNLSSLSEGIFSNCANLDSIIIPSGVKTIGKSAFEGCSSLRSISIPEAVESIEENTFLGCSSLSSVTIGCKVKSIDMWAFGECVNLVDFCCSAENVPETKNNTFIRTSIENVTLHVPAASVSAYQAVEPWKNFKEIVALPTQMAYRPFVEDGKVWKVGVSSNNPVQQVDYFYFDGDTIINGKTCKQMMCRQYVSPDQQEIDIYSLWFSQSYQGAWYEEDKKVYVYNSSNKQFKLVYDFSIDATDTLVVNSIPFVIGPKKTGGIKGFKGVYRDVMMYWGEDSIPSTPWLEGVGGLDGPTINYYSGYDPLWVLMSCTVGDEVIYFNDEYEDGATPAALGARKQRIDFTHTIKTKPKAPRRIGTRANSPAEEGLSLYGEYSNLQLDINLNPLDDDYLVRITDETGKAVYEKAVNAGNIVGLNIDISSYAEGRYQVTVENGDESFTGEFDVQTTEIVDVRSKRIEVADRIYNLQGQRIRSLQKGLNIVNGQKVYVK